MAKQKSLKLNMVLNAIKGLMSIIFPLLTFPYVSKILGVDNIGQYNFANSVVSYFVLLAGLGISTYAIREGARIRNNKNSFSQFADEMFTINIASTVFSYVIFCVLLFAVSKFHNYKYLLLILSLQVAFKTIGVEWVYSIFEDYVYITVRSIIFQIVSLILMFGFVRSKNDVCVYALITVISSVGSNVMNYIHARKYCKIRIIKSVNWRIHLKPIMVLFAMAVTVTIYVNSDTIILGFLCDDYTVGIYSVSVKVYSIIKTILSSVLVVSIPRLSSLIGSDKKEEFRVVATDIYSTLLTVVLPVVVGIIILKNNIVLLLSDNTYISATSSLTLLSIALFFCMGAWFWGQCILVPMKEEKKVCKITVVSALVNIVLNFCLIPIWKENAAAFTTIIAEALSFLCCWYSGRKYVSILGIKKTVFKVALGCLGIILTALVCGSILGYGTIFVMVTIIASIVVYVLIEIIVKNDVVLSIIAGIRKKSIGKIN